MTTGSPLHVDRGGAGGPTLLLLHGMGGSAAVWGGLIPLLAEHWPGSWLAPDLPGHGRSAAIASYDYDSLSAALAVELPADSVCVLGHSLGGALALALAAGPAGGPVEGVAAVGIKVRWNAEDIAGAEAVAARPVRTFATRAEAIDRALKVAGLSGLVDTSSAVADTLVIGTPDGWRPVFDPRALTVGAPDMTGTLAALAARGVPATLAAGELDPMSPREHLADLVPDPVILGGLGHSAHVEDPTALLPLIARLRQRNRAL